MLMHLAEVKVLLTCTVNLDGIKNTDDWISQAGLPDELGGLGS